MQRYDVMKRLGDGTYGSVWMGKHRKSGDVVAIKILKRKFSTWDECVVLRELKSLQSLPIHDNVVTIKELIREDDSQLYFVFEYMPDGNLYQLMKQSIEIRKQQLQLQQLQLFQQQQQQLQQQCNNHTMNYISSCTSSFNNPNIAGFLTPQRIQSITAQVLKGLDHIHSQGYVHRDIKPENLLLKGNICKIADFGLARKPRSRSNSPSLTEYISTRWYRAPEVLLRSPKYSAPIDIFAVGCVLSEMIELKPLFPGSSEIDQTHKVFSLLGLPNEFNWPEGVTLFDKLKVKPSILSCSLPMYEYGASSLGGGICGGGGIGGGGGNVFCTASISPNLINQESTSRVNIMRAVPNAAADPITLSFLQSLLTMNPDDRPTAKEALDDAYFKNTTATATTTTNNQKISFDERQRNRSICINANTNDNGLLPTIRKTNRNNRKRKSTVETPYIHVAAVNALNHVRKRNGVLTSTPCLEECQGHVQNQCQGQGYHHSGLGYLNDSVALMQEKKNPIRSSNTDTTSTNTSTSSTIQNVIQQQQFSTMHPTPAPQMTTCKNTVDIDTNLNEFEQHLNRAQHFQMTNASSRTPTTIMTTHFDYHCQGQYPCSDNFGPTCSDTSAAVTCTANGNGHQEHAMYEYQSTAPSASASANLRNNGMSMDMSMCMGTGGANFCGGRGGGGGACFQQQQHQPISSSVHHPFSLSQLQLQSRLQPRFQQHHNPFTFYDTLGMDTSTCTSIGGHLYS